MGGGKQQSTCEMPRIMRGPAKQGRQQLAKDDLFGNGPDQSAKKQNRPGKRIRAEQEGDAAIDPDFKQDPEQPQAGKPGGRSFFPIKGRAKQFA